MENVMKKWDVFVFLTFMFLVMVNTGGAEMKVWDGDYVPAPEIVQSKVTLGVYIFPGWYRDKGKGDYPYKTHDEDSEWKRCVAKQPKPRALLGFYDDSLPEVNDWHIKWALEHGISFFAFDWYWNAGEKRLARSLERGFLKAKYSNLMKFCIHWCNHGLDWKKDGKPAQLDFSREALLEMTKYLADNYFKLPNYLTVDGRPVFIIWQPMDVVQANGGPEGFAVVLKEMNRILRSKGFKDIYLISMYQDNSKIRDAGFDAFTGYAYYGADPDSKYEFKRGYSLPYEDFMKHQETMWKTITKSKGLPYMITTGANWDDRPRARNDGRVITGKTPEKFESACKTSLKYVDKKLNMAIIEAWNEWGEGSFIEPDQEWKFGFLDAVRKTYTDAPEKHTDYYPPESKILGYSVMNDTELARAKEIEAKKYPDPPLYPRTTTTSVDEKLPESEISKGWEFDSGSAEGWVPYHVEPFRISNGTLSTVVTEDDPQIITDNVGLEVKDIGCIAFRMKISENITSGEGFWSTQKEPSLSADKSFYFGLNPDGKWHTYQIKKKVEGKWSDVLKILRLDIGAPGNEIEIDWIRIYKGNPGFAQQSLPATKPEWEFNDLEFSESWSPMMGLKDCDVHNGIMKAISTNNDPAFLCKVNIDAGKYRYAVIKMKIDKGEGSMGQLFWKTSDSPISEENSIRFPLKPGDQFQEYALNLGEVKTWKGYVTELRFDPTTIPDSTIEVDYIKILEQPPK